MRYASAVLAVVLSCIAGCGRRAVRPDPTAVLAALDARTAILEPKGPSVRLWWLEAGLDPLRDGLAAIRSGDPAVRPLSTAEALSRVRAAEVVLVADLHDLDSCRRAFAHAVGALSSRRDRRAGRIAIALESVPLSMEKAAQDARAAPASESADPLLALLEAAWPWPVRETAALLRREDLAPCPVLAVGRTVPGPQPPPGMPDARRMPPFAPVSVEDLKYGEGFRRGNDNAVSQISRWLRGGEGRKVFVLYGAAHLLGESNLAARLRAEGFRVDLLAPFLPEWESALRRRFGTRAAESWYDVPPGVMRPPFVPDEDVLALPAPEPDAEQSVTLHR